MGVEYELKFRAVPEQLAAMETELPGEPVRYTMETTYYDTPSGALSARHYTLRCRKENGISVCTLKTPATKGARNEFEVESPDIHSALPELCKLSNVEDLPLLLAEGITPVCGARFTRLAKTVILQNCTLEIALDQGVLLGGGREIPLCEAEIELKAGTPEAAAAYGKDIARLYGLAPENRSKFYRAKLLAAGEL